MIGMLDARARVTGRVDYTINHELPGMLHARVLRSIFPHARIRAIDTARAKNLPGVHLVLTGADLRDRKDIFPYFGPVFRDQGILAMDEARFVGDPVAAVVADNLDIAQAALDLIEVDYEELPAVFDPLEALADGAPLVHSEPPRSGATFADLVIHTQASSNVCNYFKLRKGDVDAGFAEADFIFEDTFTSPAVQHVPLETHACVAQADAGRITVWTGVQTPHHLRAQLAEIFHLPLSAVRVIVPTLGGSYGSKCYLSIEPLTAVLAYLTRRPVRLHLSREEEFVTITKHAAVITLKTGVRADGRIVARKSTCYFNTGAYADIGPRLIKNAGFATGGPHSIANVWVDSYAVYTNVPSAGAFRGYGVSQAAWAYDSQLDMIAERLGLDPFEVRRQNLLVDGQTYATGDVAEDCHFVDLLDAAAKGIGWRSDEAPERHGAKVRAKGLSCVTKSTATPSTSTAIVKLNEDGSLSVLTSSVEMGQGLKTAMAIIAAERIGISIDRVSVSNVDTDVTPYDQQTSSSRSTYSMGTAVQAAMAEIRSQLLELGAQLLEADQTDLEIADGRVRVRGVPDRSLEVGEIVSSMRRGNLLGNGVYLGEGGLDPETGQGIGSVHWHQAAGGAEVEVDLETGKVDVLRYHAAVYAGRIINPIQAELQTEGSVAFGLGQALFEEMVFDGGQLQNGNLGDYMIACIEDVPPIGLSILEHPDRTEIHGLGETSLPPVMAAVGNAVQRATGVRIQDLPITPEKVLRALFARRSGQ
jgi:CO/xanthine dehydrogenase Mo-binding subunit